MSPKQRRLAITFNSLLSIIVVFAVASYTFIGEYSEYEKEWDELASGSQMVGVVLGSGIEGDQPKPLLKSRLDAGLRLLEAGKVRRLLVSGNNRDATYNEPKVMYNYLVKTKGVAPSKVQVDNAGHSTYETCERAIKVFDLREAIFISNATHLPRVLYLCRSFDINAYGFKSDTKSSPKLSPAKRFREVVARSKAILNVYIIGEKTVLDSKVDL